MKHKNVIFVLLLISLSSLTYGYYQYTRAERAIERARASEERAQMAARDAERQMKLAQEQRAIAEKQVLIANALAEQLSKKK